jgi:hypothetical protein
VLNNGVLLSEWAIGSFSDVEVNMQSSGTVTLEQTPSGVPVNVHGTDTATLNVGNNGSVQGILGPVTSTNPPDYTTINVDDSADPTPHTVTVGNGATSEFGVIHGLAPADINFKYADTAQVTISTGTGGNTVNVLATGVTTNLIGHGSDTVNIGNNGSVQGIWGTLNITNPPSYTTINVDDSADPFAQNATLSQATINGDPHWEDLSGLAPAAINYYDYDVSSVAILINSSSSVDVQDDGGIYTTVNGQQV